MRNNRANVREIKRWDFRKSHSAHMNSDGQYWDVSVLFYGKEVGYFTLEYGREYEEEGPIIMNPRNSWVTDELENIQLNDLDEEIHPLLDELFFYIEKEYPESKGYSLGGGLRANLIDEGFLEE